MFLISGIRPLLLASLVCAFALGAVPQLLAQSGNALHFDGVNDYVNVPHNQLLNMSGDFTIEAWVKFEPASSRHHNLVSKRAPGHKKGYVLKIDNSSAATGSGASIDNNGSSRATTVSNLHDGEWHHLAAVFDRDANISIYFDGNLEGTDDMTSEPGTLGLTYNLGLGSRPSGAGQFFHGTMDEVRIWGYTRSQAEILADMNGTLTGSEPNLIAYWNFDNTSGTSVPDSGPNGLHGTMVNMNPATDVVPAVENPPYFAEDPMAYTSGPLDGASGSYEDGLAGVWSNVGFRNASTVDYTITATPVTSAIGNKFDASGNGGNQGAFVRDLTAPFGDSEGAVTRWIVVVLKPKDAGSDGGFNGLRLYGNASSDVFLGWGNTGTSRVWTFDRFNGGSSGGGISSIPITGYLGQAVGLVGKIRFSGDSGPETLHLWLNPSASSEPDEASAIAVATDVNYGDITKLGLQWNYSAFVDEIRIGAEFEDVNN